MRDLFVIAKFLLLHYNENTYHNVVECTEWRRINRTIQPFHRVYENFHKITLVAHRQICLADNKEMCI